MNTLASSTARILAAAGLALAVSLLFVSPALAEEGTGLDALAVTQTSPTLSADDVEVSYGSDPFYVSYSTNSDGAVTFSSSNDAVASVSDEGLVTVGAIGTAKITITTAKTTSYWKKSVTMKVTVAKTVTAPTITSLEQSGKTMTVGWDAVDGASRYIVFRQVDGGSWQRMHTMSSRSTSFTDVTVTTGVTYRYKVRAVGLDSTDYVTSEASEKVHYLPATTLSAKNLKNCVQLTWTKVSYSSGYYIYRDGKLIKTYTSNKRVYYKDTTLENGTSHTYVVVAYYGGAVGDEAEVDVVRLERPTVTSSTHSATKLVVKWEKNASAQGYQVQCSSSPLFLTKKSVTVTSAATTQTTFTGLSSSKTYYVRMRAWTKVDGVVTYSAWAYGTNESATKTATFTRLTKSGSALELASAAGQKVGGFDTMQGACTDGTYVYYLLNRRTDESCKIVKMRLSDLKVMKVSSRLELDHGNDITYNSDTGKLYVVNTRVHTKRVSVVDPSTLTVDSYTTVSLNENIYGITDDDLTNNKGFGGISYNSSRQQYVLLTRTTQNLVILDADLQPVKYMTTTQKSGMVLQGLDTTDDYILVVSSFTSAKNYNLITVYDWDGLFITKIKVPKGYELENVFHVGTTFYCSMYGSYYTTSSGTKTLHRVNYLYKLTF